MYFETKCFLYMCVYANNDLTLYYIDIVYKVEN